MTEAATHPSLHVGHGGLLVGWSSPLGPAVARFETWSREAPVFVRALGSPGLDRPLAPLIASAGDPIVVIWCEQEGAFSAALAPDGSWTSAPAHLVPGARAIAFAPGDERGTLFAAVEEGIARLDVDARGAAIGEARVCVPVRRAGAMLAAARVRDEALLVFAHRGAPSLGVVATHGERELVVKHALRRACDDVSLCAAGGRAAVALALGGELAFGVISADGKLIERPHPVLERSGMALASPRVVWTEDRWTLLAHDRGADRLVARPLDDDGAGFALPRCHGPFAAAYWAQRFYTLEMGAHEDGGELRLFCCAGDGSEAQQRVVRLALDDLASRRARLAARQALSALSRRMSRGSYRDASARPALARDGGSMTLVDADGRVTVGLVPDDGGVRLRVMSALDDHDARLSDAPSSLVRLARWIRSRLSPEARATAAAERAFGEERAREIGGVLLRFERAGAALVLELVLSALPDVDVLEPWLRALRRAQRAGTTPP